jgi:hypothetical protein
MADTLQTLAAKQNGYPLIFNAWAARLAKLVKDYVDSTSGTPSSSIKFAGTQTSAGGDATETWTVTGALTSDTVLVSLKTKGATPRAIVTARISAANTLEVVFDGDPSTDHVVSYAIIRAIS